MARLSPGAHAAVNAGPATDAPGHARLMRAAMAWPPASPNVADPRASSAPLSVVKGDLDGAGATLVGDGGDPPLPLLEAEGVSEHAGEVDAAALRQVEVVLDAVLAHA